MGRRKVSFFFFFLFGESELARQRERVFGSCRGVFLFLCVPSERARQRERELFFVSRRRFSFSSPPSERGSASEFFFFFFFGWLLSFSLFRASERACKRERVLFFFLVRVSLSRVFSLPSRSSKLQCCVFFSSLESEKRGKKAQQKNNSKKQQHRKKKKNSTPKPPTHLADVLVW